VFESERALETAIEAVKPFREGAYARGNVYTVSAFVTLLRESSPTAEGFVPL
jgi:hypothetical protein